MHDQISEPSFTQLRKKWNLRILVAWSLISFSSGILIFTLSAGLTSTHWLLLPFITVLVFLFCYFIFFKRIGDKDVSSFLDKTFPALEESSGLLLRPQEDLNLLQTLQTRRVIHHFPSNVIQPASVTRLLTGAVISLVLSIAVCAGFYFLPQNKGATPTVAATAVKKEILPPEVSNARILIMPPAYTGKQTRVQDKFNISAEENSRITWNIRTTLPVKSLHLVFNDRSEIQLIPSDSSHTKWFAEKQVSNPGFYQVVIGSSFSELYQLEMIKDAFPSIVVRSPKPNSVIEPGQVPATQLEVLLSDDYAVKNTSISATVASGNGEAVKFKKLQLVFADFVAGARQYQLKKQIDLAALGMKPGDELYFYITATDSHEQEKRSDIYIVRIEDTTQLMSLEGLANGLDIKPEFFRSQRQIIIETEQLLKDRDTMRIELFNEKSNELGVDQKLLRLRYGKFLGEETNVEIGKDHDDHDHDTHTEISDAGNAQKMMEAVAHKHDNAEDAGFFDAQTKKQLKATLDEMWKAELQLRTMKPRDALPFEYKALKLLKELQQQSRVYVGKTGSRTPPLKLEKRLTGELDKIVQPLQRQNFQQQVNDASILGKTLGILEQLRNQETLSPASLSILEEAGLQLGTKAANEPRAYLTAFEAFGRILANKHKPADIGTAANAFEKMISTAPKLPSQGSDDADKKLSRQYFINLNRAND